MSAHSIQPELYSHPVLQVENLTVYRGQYAAVHHVSFALMPGTSTAIVGPNGSGKSTLVQAILGIMPVAAGTVEVLGCPLARLGSLRQQIGYIPQNFIFDRGFPLSVEELVALGWVRQSSRSREPGAVLSEAFPKLPFGWGQMQAARTAAVRRALKRVNAFHLRNQAIGTLSGGELKRVLLAYCLVVPRRLLVLDEAFAEVDVQGEAEFYGLLNTLQTEEGWTVLHISHDLDMVSRHCDQVLCLNRTLVCSGHPEVALSQENLLATYGPAFSRYHHHH